VVYRFSMDGTVEEEREIALKIINAYIERLENIKNEIDKEIKGGYFSFMCLGSDVERSALYLCKKFKHNDDELPDYFS